MRAEEEGAPRSRGAGRWAGPCIAVIATALAAQGVVLALARQGLEGLASERGAAFYASLAPLAVGSAAYALLAALRRQLDLLWPGLLFPLAFAAFHFASLGRGVAWYAGERVDEAWALSVFALLAWLLGYACARGSRRPAERPTFTGGGRVLSRPGLERICRLGQGVFVAGLVLQGTFLARSGLDFLAQPYIEQKRALAPDVGGASAYLNSLGMLLCLTSLVPVALASVALYRRVLPGPRFLALGVVFLAALLLQGDRGGFTLALLAVAVVHHYWVRRVRWREGVVLVVAALALYSGVRGFRGTHAIGGFVSEATSAAGYVHTFREMGSTLDVLCRAMTLVPERHDWFLGSTYLWAAARALPNLTFTPREWGFVSSVWVTRETAPEVFRQGGGLGFSVVAEGYINFGAYGAGLVLFLLGVLHGRAERALVGSRVAFWSCAAYLVLEVALINHVRNTAVAYVRGFLWSGALLLLVYLAVEMPGWRARRREPSPAAERRPSASARS